MPQILNPTSLFTGHPALILFLALAEAGDCLQCVHRKTGLAYAPVMKARDRLVELKLLKGKEDTDSRHSRGRPWLIEWIDPEMSKVAARVLGDLRILHTRVDGVSHVHL